MINKRPKPENLAKLTAEQRQVYDAWVREAEAVSIIVERTLEAMGRADKEATRAHMAAMDTLVPEVCEHHVSIWHECEACDDIWKTLFPEDFDDGGFTTSGNPDRTLN